jgi:predicted oxidoreductase
MSSQYNGATPTQLALAWLLKHPAKIIPIVGSTNPGHIKEAAAATQIDLPHADWYRLWIAARGAPMP